MKTKNQEKTKNQKLKQKKFYIKIAFGIIFLLVLLMSFFIKKTYDNHKNDMILAAKVGIQLHQIGEATQKYINIRKEQLAKLSEPSNNGNDPGPRECDQYSNTCKITYKTLINEGLLNYNFTPDYFDYNISIRKEGSANNYTLHGLITSNKAWKEKGKIKEDLLNISMSKAGENSGITTSENELWGYKGDWFINSYTFSSINEKGLLGYRVGY